MKKKQNNMHPIPLTTILKNKQKILAQKDNCFMQYNIKNITKTKYITKGMHKKILHNFVPINQYTDDNQEIIQQSYVLLKKDVYVKMLEEKFNIEWTKDNIHII